MDFFVTLGIIFVVLFSIMILVALLFIAAVCIYHVTQKTVNIIGRFFNNL